MIAILPITAYSCQSYIYINDMRLVFKKYIYISNKCYYNNEIKKCGNSSKSLYKFINNLRRKNKQNIFFNNPLSSYQMTFPHFL